MYNTVDDINEEPLAEKPVGKKPRLWLFAAIIFGVGLLILIAFISLRNSKPLPNDNLSLLAENKAFATAMAEADMALQRARMMDFMKTYPASEHLSIVRPRLDVLNTMESREWANLSYIIFDINKSRTEKLSAMTLYEKKWKPTLLGGRADSFESLKAMLEKENLPEPEHNFHLLPNNPTTLNTEKMAGGSGYAPPQQQRLITLPSHSPQQTVIEEPQLLRNTKLQYPRRALRAGIEASVDLLIYIDVRGHVYKTDLISAEADAYGSGFLKAAERAAKHLRYTPYRINGTPKTAPQGIIKRFRFQLDD